MDYQSVVRESAESLELLDDSGKLKKLDSLAIIDLVTTLEERTQVSIPTAALVPQAFESIETIAELLQELTS